MKRCAFTLFSLIFAYNLCAQQQVILINECGGVDTITIPAITDNDLDGMDDALEQLLLDRFMPYIVQYNSDGCPGPNTNGTGDTNLVVSRIFPLPQQYISGSSLDSIKVKPVAIVPPRGLTVGLTWYNTVVKVNSALLYGRDCGLTSHTADVEGFNFSLKYIGTLPSGWMYDTDMQHWQGDNIQTVSHAGTFCEAVQTFPYRSAANPTGKDTIYPSPDKHGSFLTVAQCSSNFICDPSCSGAFTLKKIKNVNIGEPNAPLVTDLGTVYAPYAGNNPWGNTNFLGGGAGTIKEKMTLEYTSAFFQGTVLTQPLICNLYRQCFGGAGSAILAYTCSGTPYPFYNQQLTASGTYTQTVLTPYGCDSVVTLTLQVGNPDTITITQSICGGTTYPFDGQQLSTTGTYHAQHLNLYGCDSLTTLHLFVDTVIRTQYAESLCDGDTYLFHGQSLWQTGSYFDTLSAMGGCDSIVELQLQVEPLPSPPTIQAVDVLLSTDTVGIASYQWYLNDTAIAGATTATFVTTTSGYYQVAVSNTAGCIALSDSLYVTTVGISNTGLSQVKLYPNPAQQFITLELPQGHSTTITIFNGAGQSVQTFTTSTQRTSLNIADWPAGLYFVQISGEGYRWSSRFLKVD